MSGARTIEVAPDEAGLRLDRWFRGRFPGATQGRIERMCRKGEIRVDGARAKAAARVEAGQVVRVPPLPAARAAGDDPPERRPRRVSRADARAIRAAVIHRDDHVLVLNKPPGLPTQGGTGQARHVDGLAEALRFGGDEKPRLVHRLDKDTSGVLLMARTRKAASLLAEAFRTRDTLKVYWAAVAGVPSPRTGAIRLALAPAPGRGPGGEGEKMRCLPPDEADGAPGARRAVTEYSVIEALGKRASWVALSPVTGRTHQVRAHLAGIGCPVVGDGKYGGSGQENRGDGWGAGLGGGISRRLHLHARSLAFAHPATGERVSFEAPLPDHMARSWEAFGWSADQAPGDLFGNPSGAGA